MPQFENMIVNIICLHVDAMERKKKDEKKEQNETGKSIIGF